MKRIITGFVAAVCLATLAQTDTSLPDSSQWEDVFNRDLSNAEFKTGSWSWDNEGYLVPQTDDVIFSRKDYTNFVVDVAYITQPEANSGLFLYDTKHPTHKFEIQIFDDCHPKYTENVTYQRTGAIYGRIAPTKVCSKPTGELNRMVVYCRGPHIKIFVNGEKVVDADLTRWTNPLVNPDGTPVPVWHKNFPALATIPMHGRIALQGVHGGKAARFKYLKVKELK